MKSVFEVLIPRECDRIDMSVSFKQVGGSFIKMFVDSLPFICSVLACFGLYHLVNLIAKGIV